MSKKVINPSKVTIELIRKNVDGELVTDKKILKREGIKSYIDCANNILRWLKKFDEDEKVLKSPEQED